MVVSSFHISSTRDVWLKTCSGLKANGVTVIPFDLMRRLALYSFLRDKVELSKKHELPRDWDPTTLSYEVILGAAVYHDADWVIVTSPQYFPIDIARMLRKVGIKTAAMWTECPYEDTIHTPITASAFDASFVNDKNSLMLFESFCEQVLYVPHSYDPDLHYPSAEEAEDTIVFVGTGYQSRVQFMRKVEWPVKLDLYGWWPKEWLRYDDKRLRPSLRSTHPTTPQETADLYRKSAASFSMHREMRYAGTDEAIMDGEAYSLGPRNWELAASGCFQISDARPELTDVFGDTVPLYETPAEMSALFKRAFREPSWRKDMAAAQRERALPYSSKNVMLPVAQLLSAVA